MSEPTHPRLLRTSELAAELNIPPWKIRRLARAGKITPDLVLPTGQYRWRLETVRRELGLAPAPARGGRRPPRPGERCTCGRPAVVVYLTDRHGEVPWCGTNNGGAS